MMNGGVTTRGRARPEGAGDVTSHKRRSGSPNGHTDQRRQKAEMITQHRGGGLLPAAANLTVLVAGGKKPPPTSTSTVKAPTPANLLNHMQHFVFL